jgi:hypothetical protein
MGHRAWGKTNFGLRIAKLGTRPKGGSPQDNLKARSQETGDRRQKRRRGETETRRSLFGSAFLAVSPFRPFYVSFRFASNLKRSAPPTSNSMPFAQSAFRNPQSPPWGWLGFCTSKKLQKLLINPQTRWKDISFKFMYVTVLLIKIIGYSFL